MCSQTHAFLQACPLKALYGLEQSVSVLLAIHRVLCAGCHGAQVAEAWHIDDGRLVKYNTYYSSEDFCLHHHRYYYEQMGEGERDEKEEEVVVEKAVDSDFAAND